MRCDKFPELVATSDFRSETPRISSMKGLQAGSSVSKNHLTYKRDKIPSPCLHTSSAVQSAKGISPFHCFPTTLPTFSGGFIEYGKGGGRERGDWAAPTPEKCRYRSSHL